MSAKRKYDDNQTNDSEPDLTIKKTKKKKNVRFDDVTVYYFARSQGFISVPSQGTITLGL
jgi:cysteine/serine-rich nuclear protein